LIELLHNQAINSTLASELIVGISAYYPDGEAGKQPTYDQLRVIVREAWDLITVEFLRELIESMPARCQAVIDAKGGHTKY
jgi:hypothetical protein